MSAIRLVLEIVSGPYQGKLIVVGAGECVRVGRTSKADVLVSDTFLSSVHFAVECDDKGGCKLRDLKSRNGTKLNGEIIEEAPLKHGDQVFAGQTDFIVRLEEIDNLGAGQILSRSLGGSKRKAKKSRTSRKQADVEEPTYDVAASTPAQVDEERAMPTTVHPAAPPVELKERPQPPPSPGPGNIVAEVALSSYESATPEGRLFHILSYQPQPLMALIDGVRDRKALELLKIPGVKYCSLYKSEVNAALSPYLINLPSRSAVLKQMIKEGWGHEWGVYLTCPFSISELRDYFRNALMVTTPDGMELFSRFYDPRFFRDFLEGCDCAQAEKFFGPVSSYFMEDVRPEILLQYTNSKSGTEKKGHLLSDLV